jgi:type IV pilus biogenesis protein CpaD/CtpE
MSIDTRTNPTSTVRQERPAFGTHSVAVAFSVWGAQPTSVTARDGGGLEDKPYIAVAVGDCLTYAYDRDALFSHVHAWRDAAAQNTSLRLPTTTVAATAAATIGQDTSVLTNVIGHQRHAITAETTPAGDPVLSVRVGALTVRVHTAPALRCYLTAWERAAALAPVLDLPPTRRRPRRRP